MKKLTLITTIALLSCHPAWSAHDNNYTRESELNIKYCGHFSKIIAHKRFHISDTSQAVQQGWVLFETPIVNGYKEMVKCFERK